MAKVSEAEVRKIAQISDLNLHDDEISGVIKQLQDVLTYAERVTLVASDAEEPSNKRVNVFREDVVNKTNPTSILAGAPEREADYFVVPAVLESTKE